MVFNPNQIRSVNARYDPKNINSSDILAGLGSLGLVGSSQKSSDNYAFGGKVNSNFSKLKSKFR